MTGIQGSLGEIDLAADTVAGCEIDPLATLLASRQRRTVSRHRDSLQSIVLQEVVPRLAKKHRLDLRPANFDAICRKSDACDEAIAPFASRLLASDLDGAIVEVEALQNEGLSLECLFLYLLAPAALELDTLWSQDRAGFAEVALGFHTLHAVLRKLASAFRGQPRPSGRRALILSPSSKRMNIGRVLFGLAFAAEFYRRDGWETRIEAGLATKALQKASREEWFDSVTIGACEREHVDTVASAIQTIRRHSPNRSVSIVVHGPFFVENPDYGRVTGADFVSLDARSSLTYVQHVVSLPKPRSRLR